jgi:hypothetical protein
LRTGFFPCDCFNFLAFALWTLYVILVDQLAFQLPRLLGSPSDSTSLMLQG